MATYTDLSSNFAVNGPMLASEGKSLRDNIIAVSEGSTNAPYAQAIWHPYDGVEWGDGNDGALWSQSVDGTQNQVTSPAWVDGYEYRVILYNLRQDQGTAQDMDIEAYLSGDSNSWQALSISPLSIPASTSSVAITVLDFMLPRLTRNEHQGAQNLTTAFTVSDVGNDNKIQNIRFTMPGGVNLDQGAIYLHRRRAFY